MNKTRKGISQVLFLIIAASVLMMVALTLIFMFQGGAGDADRDATIQACVSSVETQCQYTANEDNEVRMPSQCQGQDGEIYPEVSDFESTTDGMIDCDSV